MEGKKRFHYAYDYKYFWSSWECLDKMSCFKKLGTTIADKKMGKYLLEVEEAPSPSLIIW